VIIASSSFILFTCECGAVWLFDENLFHNPFCTRVRARIQWGTAEDSETETESWLMVVRFGCCSFSVVGHAICSLASRVTRKSTPILIQSPIWLAAIICIMQLMNNTSWAWAFILHQSQSPIYSQNLLWIIIERMILNLILQHSAACRRRAKR
jgi:hypothetical protein